MATKAAHKRLTREYKLIQENPTQYIEALPSETNILEWHYLITGPPDTPYDGGQYHGTLVFPADYPFKPPAIRMMTPSGRFKTNTRLCLSISDYHPKSWNPAWSVSTILTGLLSFMCSEESTAGSITSTEDYRKKLAKESRLWNIKYNAQYNIHFPEIAQQSKIEIAQKQAQEALNPTPKSTTKPPTTNISKTTINTTTPADEQQQGFSARQKVFCVVILIASWVLASHLLEVYS